VVIVSLLILLTLVGLMHAARSYGGDSGTGTLMVFGYLTLASFFTGNTRARSGFPSSRATCSLV